MSSVPPEVRAYCAAVATLLQRRLGSDLVGLYLHGSAAMRAWTPTRSDVDLLAVVARSLTPSEKRDIGQALLAMPSPGVGLEFSMVTVAAAREVTSAPPFELHVAGAEGRMVDGAGHGDEDLLAHFAMTRARGVAILGPPPSDVIEEPATSALLRSLAADLQWAMDNRNYGYAVLNACRGLMYAREGTLGSKVEGASWAKRTGTAPADLVDVALARQEGAALRVPDTEATRRFVAPVRDELLKAAESKPRQ